MKQPALYCYSSSYDPIYEPTYPMAFVYYDEEEYEEEGWEFSDEAPTGFA